MTSKQELLAQIIETTMDAVWADYEAAVAGTGVFSVREPLLASFGILELCVSIAHWFRADGPLSVEDVAREHAEFAVRIARG